MAYVSEKKAKENQQILLSTMELIDKYAGTLGVMLEKVHQRQCDSMSDYVSQMNRAGFPKSIPVWGGDGRICCVCQIYDKHGIQMVKVPIQMNPMVKRQFYKKYDVVKCAAAGCYSMLERG